MVVIGSKPSGRARPSLLITLLLVALTVLVAAGAAFLVLARHDALDRPAHPLSDEQSKAQVLEPAREIVAVARLQNTVGGYILMSCESKTDPPYQGAIYLTFDLPKTTDYFDQIAAELVSHGWRITPPPSRYLSGISASKNGVTAILYRDPDRDGSGVMKVYGECRNVVDHRNDTAGWVDITDQLH